VRIGGECCDADAVISNSDVYYTYANLLDDAHKAAAIQKQERSTSGIVFYWGVQKTSSELRLHNIFFSDDYREEFGDLRAGRLPADPTVYVNITSKMDAVHAPSGCENWFVLVNAPAGIEISAEGEKASLPVLREVVIQKLSSALRTNLAPLILTEDILDPADIEAQTGSYLGALYGTASNSAMAAFNRHPNRSRKYRGLYFCGGTVHPGGGIPLCLRSGRLAADAAERF
jgi:phytoene dehydrogenase-like protein